MCAVVESAVLREVKDILKVACQLFGLDVESSKPLNARSVDKVATLWQQKHFAKGSGVHACVVSIRYRRSAQVGTWQYIVDECRLAYTAVSAQ